MSNKNENLAKHQAFTAETINRKQIKNAPYNPRRIDVSNRSLLKRNLKKIGLIETLVWNKTTGNIVSGHQRLSLMDELEGRGDYDLTVAMVEFDLTGEKEQNIFMNNPNAQGDWDRDLMMDVIPDIDMRNAGFTASDMSAMGVEFDIEKHIEGEVEDVIAQFDNIKEENKERAALERAADPTKKDWKDVKKDIQKNIDEKSDAREDYFVVTFDNPDKKEAFLKRFGFDPDERYLKGEVLTGIINDHLGE